MPLFVGGIRDGDWFKVPDDCEMWTVRERLKPVQVNPDPLVPVEPSYHRQETYTRMRFRGLDDTYTVYAGRGLDPDAVLYRLIMGYRPAESEGDSHVS